MQAWRRWPNSRWPNFKWSSLKWSNLSWRDRLHLVFALGMLPFIVASLRLFGYRRTKRRLERLSPRPLQQPVAISKARQHGQIANIAANHCVGRANCLPRSLYLWWFLRFLRWDSKICFGARKIDGALQAHAWVECEGVPVNDSVDVDQRYQPFVSPDEARTLELNA